MSEIAENDIVETFPNNPELQWWEVLRTWKESKGLEATYRRLITIKFFCLCGRAATALKLQQLLNVRDCQEVINLFQCYLYACYSELECPSSLQWPPSLNSEYTELELIECPVDAKGDS